MTPDAPDGEETDSDSTYDVPERASDRVAAHIRSLRQIRNETAERLAAACASAGAPEITRSVIANIESGRKDEDGIRTRDMTVDELVVISRALGFSPVVFLARALEEPHEILRHELYVDLIPVKPVRKALREAAKEADDGHIVWLVRRDGTRVAAIVSVHVAIGWADL